MRLGPRPPLVLWSPARPAQMVPHAWKRSSPAQRTQEPGHYTRCPRPNTTSLAHTSYVRPTSTLMGAKFSFNSSIKMGCAISGGTSRPGGEGGTAAGPPQLSDDQIQMIKGSWKVIRDDIAKVGIIMFVRLFETHPECKDVFFLFRGVEDLERLRTSRELRAHGLRVMSFIEKSVARLDQLDRLEAMAVELGKSHYRYNAPPKYYNYVGAEFICAVQPILKEQWTTELEEAWKTMFLYVTDLMKQGYQEAERMHFQPQSSSPKERPDKRNTVL